MTGRTAPAGGQPLALAMPDRNSWLIIIGLLAALILLMWVASRIIRSQGGFRRTCRRVVWEARMTGRAFSQPLRAWRLHRRCARMLTSFLADPEARELVGAALDRADAAQGAGCYAPTVWIGPSRDRTRVVIAGRDPLGPSGEWTDAAAGPGEWTWSAPAPVEPSAVEEDRERLLLVVGVDRRAPGVVLVDWRSGPPALVVEGDARVARSVVHALTAQLDSLPHGPEVLVARGLHPRFPGPELDDLIADLAVRGSAEAAPVTDQDLETAPDPDSDPDTERDADLPPVLACWMPNPQQAERLAALSSEGKARVLVGGSLPGSSWTLHAEPDGRLLGPGMQIDVEAASLGRAVGRAIRRLRSRARATAPATAPSVAPPPGTPETPSVTTVEVATVEAATGQTGAGDPDFTEPAASPAVTTEPSTPAAEPDVAHGSPGERAPLPATAAIPAPAPAPDLGPAPAPQPDPTPAPAPAPVPALALDPDLDLAEPEPAAAPTRSAGVSATSRPQPAAPGEIPDRTAPTP
ncbi:hypothetical protein [Streptomyces sp. H39-S7]|uniref:hypothetical protein n=1 Tax=Streptomyces sp. H39-S7 TaxID=3004357 RepID=UPI0022AE7082|nr:hypothetical protein [Streptomyces sp. H39-S7]MCZ4124713.1 hypothetical protein [Streptomyces sp. H39-S7]